MFLDHTSSIPAPKLLAPDLKTIQDMITMKWLRHQRWALTISEVDPSKSSANTMSSGVFIGGFTTGGTIPFSGSMQPYPNITFSNSANTGFYHTTNTAGPLILTGSSSGGLNWWQPFVKLTLLAPDLQYLMGLHIQFEVSSEGVHGRLNIPWIQAQTYGSPAIRIPQELRLEDCVKLPLVYRWLQRQTDWRGQLVAASFKGHAVAQGLLKAMAPYQKTRLVPLDKSTPDLV